MRATQLTDFGTDQWQRYQGGSAPCPYREPK